MLKYLVMCILLVSAAYGAPTRAEIERAKKVAKAGHTCCEYCLKPETFLRRLEAHHAKPQERFPEMAADTNNFAVVCRRCHLYVAHAGNFGKYVANIKEIIAMRKIEENRK